MGADLAIINAKVITVDNDFSIQQAVAVKDDKITVVGTNEDVKPHITSETRVLDLRGKPVLPGINDAHMHATEFGAMRPPLALDLTYETIKSIPEMIEALRKKVAEVKPGEWIRGFGWSPGTTEGDQNNPTRLPHRSDIDPVSPNNPVSFMDAAGHTLLVNSKALEIGGISKYTPDPKTGEMERDPVTGEPTGIFMEMEAIAMISNAIPHLTREEKKQAIINTLDDLKRNGITSYTEGAVGPGGDAYLYGLLGSEFIDVYAELQKENRLTARVNALLLLGKYGSLTMEDLQDNIESLRLPRHMDKIWLNFPAIKIFADGIPSNYTAWMNEDYVSGDAGHGVSTIPGKTDQEQRDNLIEMIEYIHSKGFQIGVHAVGDRAIDATVDGFVRAIEKMPEKELRHYVIHGDFISADKAKLLGKYRCGIVMQPSIAAIIADFEPEIVGEERAAYEWPTRTVLDAGANLTSSSDAAAVYPNWRLGVQDAVLREGRSSGIVSGPEECITVEEAIRTYTINGAWQDHMEDIKGSIEVGKLADFCVIDSDILEVDPHQIGEIGVIMTIVGGKIVFDERG
ncbi:MAG: amidohydrolase [Deltaproteobacteria bacterium]|nr:amidohydrolase [Deltaproteobacteria bacterium]